MQRKTYVSRFCVLLFLIIEDANVNALSLTSCDNPLENEVCNLTCTTTDHSRNVVFDKVPDVAIIAQCVTGVRCFGKTSEYSISQPNSVTTVLSFIHSRNSTGTWRCSYGPTPTSVPLPWATYPLTVTTTLTSNTTVDTNIDGNVTLGCLYSEQAPTVTLQYEDANGNNDAMSAETFKCEATDIPCTDVNFTTYECPVVVKEETGIDNSDTYSIKLKIKVSHVETEDVHTIITDITFKPPSTSSTTPGSEDTDTNPDNDSSKGLVIGVVIGVIVVVSVSVLVVVLVVWMKKKKKKFLNNDQKDPDHRDHNDASETSRSQSCIRNGTVTPHETGKSQKKSTFDIRQPPEGHEGPQSTPKDPDARHLTTGRPLPRRPDIVSPQTGPFDSVNSPRPIGLAPIENPNIPPSIDTLDEQKTDKKPKDKKKKKKKKKKMTDEEQDNPAYTGQ